MVPFVRRMCPPCKEDGPFVRRMVPFATAKESIAHIERGMFPFVRMMVPLVRMMVPFVRIVPL